MKNENKPIRESNFELLRIVSMFMIMILHIGTHGIQKYIDTSTLSSFNEMLYHFLRSLSIIAVNIYVLISAYFLSQSTFKLKKLVLLFVETSFFFTLIFAITSIFGYPDFNMTSLKESLFAVIFGKYWFVTAYFVLFALSPYLNKLLNTLSKKEHLNLIVITTLICCAWQFYYANSSIGIGKGYGVPFFIYLYIVGAYIRNYQFILKDLNKNLYLISYLVLAIVNTMIVMSAANTEGDIGRWYNYNSPIVLIMSYALFQYFRKIHIKSTVINSISKYVFGIYLLHEHTNMRSFLWIDSGVVEKITNLNNYMFIIYTLGYSIIVFISCWIGSYIISKVFSFIMSNVDKVLLFIKGKMKMAV